MGGAVGGGKNCVTSFMIYERPLHKREAYLYFWSTATCQQRPPFLGSQGWLLYTDLTVYKYGKSIKCNYYYFLDSDVVHDRSSEPVNTTEGSGIRIKVMMWMLMMRLVPDNYDHEDQRQEDHKNPILEKKSWFKKIKF